MQSARIFAHFILDLLLVSNRFFYKKLLLPVTLRAPGCESGARYAPGHCNFRTVRDTIIFPGGAVRVYTARRGPTLTEGA